VLSPTAKRRLEDLLQDAEAVLDLGIQLGRLKDAQLLAALQEALKGGRAALDSGATTQAISGALQTALGNALVDLSPLTLGDAHLLRDAGLVADVGVRLGRLKNSELSATIGKCRQGLAGTTFSPDLLAALQGALNNAMGELYPITLSDLRAGWRPYGTPRHSRLALGLFFAVALGIVVLTAYTTTVYERAKSLYATSIELQDARGAEQAMRLFGLLKRNQQEIADSLDSGKKEFLYEVFGKALIDLEITNLKSQTFTPIARDVLQDLERFTRLKAALDLTPLGAGRMENPSGSPTVGEYLPNYSKAYSPEQLKQLLQDEISSVQTELESSKKSNVDAHTLLRRFLEQLKEFNRAINVQFDPTSPNEYFFTQFHLREGITFIGLWLLPPLYGMLGAVIFHLRRLLDPVAPNPPWLQVIFRMILGAFAGTVIVLFWNPPSNQVSPGDFVTLTSFGVAFLAGFSTDVFFQALDRFVTYLSQLAGSKSA
jgi:hypothetical protein